MSNTIEGVYSREVSLIHLKDRETIHLDREITRPDKETMHLDRDNMLLSSIEDLVNKKNIDKIETTFATKMIQVTTMTI